MGSSARVLVFVQLLASSVEANVATLAQRVGFDPTRWELLDELAQQLPAFTALTRQIMQGVRLMQAAGAAGETEI